MKRVLVVALIAACGPSVGVDEESTTDGTTTSAGSSATSPMTMTTATTATTQSTSATTMMGDASTSSGSTGGTETESGDSGAQMIESPDGGGSQECDVWAQDCYPVNKCMPWSNTGEDAWNATRCSPIHPAPAGIGEPCHVEDNPYTGVDDCELGAMCWDVDPTTLEGECVSNCSGSEHDPICDDGTSCWIEFEGTIHLCLPSCDPLAPECEDGELCAGRDYGYGYTPPVSFVCLPAAQFQPQPYGHACEYFEVCDAGLACVRDDHVPGCTSSACCTVIGESSTPPACPDPTQTCIPFDDAMPLDGLCYCGVEA